MSIWIPVTEADRCPPGQALEVVAGDRIIALFNVDGQFFAIDGVCPHQGGPLGQGALSGCIVTCPWHGWQFDVKTGQSQLSENIVQPSLVCKVEGSQIFVDVEPAES